MRYLFPLFLIACTNIGVVQIGNGNSSSVKQDVSQGITVKPKLYAQDAGTPSAPHAQYGLFEEQ